MNIGSVMTSYVQSTTIIQSPDGSASQPSAATPSSDASSQVHVSQPGQLMKQLSDLQQSDPAKFKEVVQQISESFGAAAKNATGEDAKHLTELADKFAQAAQSGDMSAFQPPQHAQNAQEGQKTHRSYEQASGGRRHHAPSQAMQDAFSSALSIVKAA